MLTVNGRVQLYRIRWHDAQEGSQTPLDGVLDEVERAISEGVREMACRLNRGVTSFEQAAGNLARTAHLTLSKETLRQLIEHEGRSVVEAQRRGCWLRTGKPRTVARSRAPRGSTRRRWRDGAAYHGRGEEKAAAGVKKSGSNAVGAPPAARARPR
jgi:hypothetical protein